jgi:hypothetical protein
MAETKISINQAQFRKIKEKLKDLRTPVDKATASAIGKKTVALMKSDIARGQSPILGKGRFKPYKNPKKYPGKRKPARPVNLFLSGKFIKSLKFRVEKFRLGWRTFVGYLDNQLSEDKEKGHRIGKFGQEKRPTIPIKKERFNTKIATAIRKIFNERVRQITKKR